MNAIYFIDKAPEAALPLPALTFADDLPQQSSEDPAVPVIDNDLAYILFTPGSTGVPKGVMPSHFNADILSTGCETFGITANDRLSNHAPFNFDLSVFDFFVSVKAGAAISLVPEGLAVFPLQLSSFTQDQKITVWYSVPMVLALLQAGGRLEERDLAALRWVLFAGEVFPTKHLRTLMERLPHPRYANLYGPTGTNVCAYYEVEPLSLEQTAPIPIGKACANTDLIPINAEGKRVVTTNEEGLLYARGSTVMQGYYGRPEALRSVFHPQPLYRGPRQPTMGAGLVFDAWGSYGRCDLARQKPAGAHS